MEPTTEPTGVSSEPVAWTEAVRTLILAVFATTTAFEVWEPTAQQTGAVLGLVIAVSVVLSTIARLKSTPTAKVALTLKQANAIEAAKPPQP